MSYLLALSIGPVQEFIAASRRTTDLQAGSELLVAVTQAAAGAVEARVREGGGRLIFPARADLPGANKILAELERADPADTARVARLAAMDCLCRRWQSVQPRLPREALDPDLAADQVEHFLEFYAAWVPVEGADYAAARRDVERLLGGRKALRDFAPPLSRPRRPKSPLDPARDCALQTGSKYQVPPGVDRRPLWLKNREVLDAVSLLKRVEGVEGAGRAGTPSTSLMALRSFLPDLEARAPDELRDLRELEKRVHPAADLGDFFFPGRSEVPELLPAAPEERAAVLRAVRERAVELADLDDDALVRLAERRREALRKLGRREAPPYYAILVADGDRMGRLLGQQDHPDAHRRLSESLAVFAEQAAEVVRKHRGHPVYCGGDDVLALLPVTEALAAAAALASAFGMALEGDATLSVGVAIVHHLEPLLESLAHARQAESAAKERRDSLALALHPRGGSPTRVSRPWDPADRLGEWAHWTRAFAGSLSRGVPYELRDLALELKSAPVTEERLEKLLQAEVRRIFARKKGGSEASGASDAGNTASGSTVRSAPGWVRTADDLEQFASLLIIARFLARPGEASG